MSKKIPLRFEGGRARTDFHYYYIEQDVVEDDHLFCTYTFKFRIDKVQKPEILLSIVENNQRENLPTYEDIPISVVPSEVVDAIMARVRFIGELQHVIAGKGY